MGENPAFGSPGPPKWPLKILRFFIKEKYLEEIEGDMEEIFRENQQKFSSPKARRRYTMEVLKLLRPVLIMNLTSIGYLNTFSMFKNYLKISLRNLARNPLSSFINIFGLAAALGICIFTYAFAQWTYSTDQFHQNKNEVFLITFFANRDGRPQQFGFTPRPLGEMLANDFAQIKKVCRIVDKNVVVKVDDQVFHERIRFTDNEFLQMLTFPLKWGSKSSLAEAQSIILSENMSIKYFGQENPIGKDILVKFDNERGKVFKVTGVALEFPKSRTISFDFLVNYANLKAADPGYILDDWASFVNATLVQVDNPDDLRPVEASMNKYQNLYNQMAPEDWAISSFRFEPLATLHKNSEDIRDDISRSSKVNYTAINYLVAVGAFLLILACLNYINIAIATAAKRIKEIGVRKSIGATRRIVTLQFLSENVILIFFALFVGFILGYSFFIPGFEQLWNFNMDFHISDFTLWIFILVILLFTSFISGLYPALYISKFQIVGILKGSVKFGQKNLLTKIFLAFQLTFACIFITIAIMFNKNNSYMAKRPWGYNYQETMYTKVPDYPAYEKLSAELSRDPGVVSVAGSVHHLSKGNSTAVLHLTHRDFEVELMEVSPNYFETLGLHLQEGRFLQEQRQSDQHSAVVNQMLAANLGLENAIGQTFRIDSVSYEVIGVVKDFHSYSFSQPVRPLLFTMADKNSYQYLTVRARPDSKEKTLSSLRTTWSKFFPEIPFEGGYQEDTWANYFISIKIYDTVWKVISFIAVGLASLGLYGLVTLNVTGRSKEFSIRKILGAGIISLATAILKSYLGMFITAVTIGASMGFILSKLLFESSFPYHVPVGITSSVFAVFILIGILLTTIIVQIVKLQKTDPVIILRTD